ncbi:MAG TPA: hypothetical protein VMB78_03605 [Dissulfurispiraceae bacterium]|nr:hypothetical protein [Dissulfurispiraceae bacterium]
MEHFISEATRKAIIDHFRTSGIKWNGRLQDNQFLGRLFDLTSMPSTDHRVWNADSDIIQHRVIWKDWNDDWLFTDRRFNLLNESDEIFLRFLCETIHPLVRPDTEEAFYLAEHYNLRLAVDGWRIVEVGRISGKPVFGHERADTISPFGRAHNN